MASHIEAPEVPVVMEAVLVQRRKFTTEQENFTSSGGGSYNSVGGTGSRTGGRHEFAPLMFLRSVSEDVVIEVLASTKSK